MRFRLSIFALVAASVSGFWTPIAQAQHAALSTQKKATVDAVVERSASVWVADSAPKALSQDQSADSGLASVALRPGDSIRVQVFREPDLSGEFGIDEKGYATLPRIGPLLATSYKPDSLKAYIISQIGSTLRDPTITVTFLRRVTILGAVAKPGLYGADPTMTIADVLALAGGATPDGKRDHVTVYRDGVKYRANIATATSLNQSGIRSGDQIYVEERSWISRNPYLFTGILGSAIAIVALLARR